MEFAKWILKHTTKGHAIDVLRARTDWLEACVVFLEERIQTLEKRSDGGAGEACPGGHWQEGR